MRLPSSAQRRPNRLTLVPMKGGPIAPGPTDSIWYGWLLKSNQPYDCLSRPSCSPISSIFVLKDSFRLDDPTRVPFPRHKRLFQVRLNWQINCQSLYVSFGSPCVESI